jgi:microcystin-dependent protein
MGVLWGRSTSVERDNNDVRAIGAKAYFFAAGTSTPYTVYQDADESTPHTHPVEADGYGRWPNVFIPFGDFKFLLTTAGGSTLASGDEIPNPAPFTDDFELDETAIYNTGDFIFTGKNGTRAGAVRCNGRTLGNAASGATERANADTVDLFTYLYDNYTNDEAAVSSGRGASAAADYAANKTITLPDYRGTALVGFDDMGNTAASRFAGAPTTTGSGTEAGSILGLNTHTLLEAQLPNHTHSFSATTGAGGSHTHGAGSLAADAGGGHTPAGSVSTPTITVNNGTGVMRTGGTPIELTGGGGYTTSTITATSSTPVFTGTPVSNHTHVISGTTGAESSHTHSVSGTTGTGSGSGSAHNNMQRSAPVNILMKL